MIYVSEFGSWQGNRESSSISTASEPFRRPESLSAGAPAPSESHGYGGRDHGQVRHFRELRHAGVGGTIISGLSGHRCSDDCCNSAARNKLQTVAPAVVLYPPRMTTPNVTLSAFPARISPPRSWIQNPNVYSFVL